MTHLEVKLLPILKKTPQVGLIITQRKPDEVDKAQPEEEGDASGEAAFQDIMEAIKSGDVKAGAKALRSAFEIFDSEPHEEGPHTDDSDDNSFQSQNRKAAQD